MTPEDDIAPKWLTVAQLRRVLATLPDDFTVMPNRVGNLRVGDKDLVYKGYIDFLFEGSFDENLVDTPP
jgi:hypothetical protein